MRRLISLSWMVALGCSCADDAPASDSGTTDTAITDSDPAAEPLRPNVQQGVPPNAEGQQPAFPEQTRAPQPARATAFSTEVVARGLQVPWGLAELPDGRLLVTERPGRLRVVAADGTVSPPVSGVPDVLAAGQGGLLDVAVSPDFASDRAVFLTFSEDRGEGRSATAVARGTLAPDAASLQDLQILYRQQPAWNTTRHFGSRLVFDDEGHLYVTFGDRGSAFDDAQDPGNAVGAVVRLLPDGRVPDDNPMVGDAEAAPEVWSYGHRNIQSATWGPDGALWTVEHGPRGGDELNRPVPGANHGWPLISYGEDYNGLPVRRGETAREGLEQPVYYWDPVIAPSDMATYAGEVFAGWQGNLLVGGLQAEALVRLSLRDGKVSTEEWLPLGVRVRSVHVTAGGGVLVGTDAGEIVRIVPD